MCQIPNWFPFKEENIRLFIMNILKVLDCKRMGEILLVGFRKNETYKKLENFISSLPKGEDVKLILQKRIGAKREGKGDGMNTAIDYFIKETNFKYLHFYDSDISTFNAGWIERAQRKIDEGYEVVRCYYPRVYTDAMVTWNITKCGFAYIWPDTILSKIEQPLGGEIAIKRIVARKLTKDKMVRNSSDWSIDTAYTTSFCKHKFSLYEIYIPEGKFHRFYGKLSQLKTMVLECFQILKENQFVRIDTKRIKYGEDPLGKIPKIYKEKTAFDIKGTISEFRKGWNKEEKELLDLFPKRVKEGVLKCQKKIDFEFMDPENWYYAFEVFLKYFNENEEKWKNFLFHLWVARVLNHTLKFASEGYNQAMRSLTGMIKYFKGRALLEHEIKR